MPDPLPALRRLPQGSAVILRHYEWPYGRRLALARAVADLCRQRGLTLLVAGDARLARAVGAAGVHLPQELLPLATGLRRQFGMVTAAAHDAGAVARAGVDAVLISPVFATASHPGAEGLGAVRFAALAHKARRKGLQVYALGGMNAATSRRLKAVAIAGIAGISGFAGIAGFVP